MSLANKRRRGSSKLAPGLRFARELAKFEIQEFLNLLRDPDVEDLSEATASTWLAVLSLVAKHPHGLTWASTDGICEARRRICASGSSKPTVKRHMLELQERGLLVRFAEHRAKDRNPIRRLQVIVVMFPEEEGRRRARSPESRSLIQGWNPDRIDKGHRRTFPGPIVNSKRTPGARRRVKFAELLPLHPHLAARAADQHLDCTARNHKRPDVMPLTIQAADSQTQNRASAGVSLAPEPSGDLADHGELADPVQAADYPVLGLSKHRRPQGGTLGHPRPEGGSSSSQTTSERRAS